MMLDEVCAAFRLVRAVVRMSVIERAHLSAIFWPVTAQGREGPRRVWPKCGQDKDGSGASLSSANRSVMSPASACAFHKRTVLSSQTPNASAIRALVHLRRVNWIALALSPSARSHPPAFASSAAICCAVAATRRLHDRPHSPEQNQKPLLWERRVKVA